MSLQATLQDWQDQNQAMLQILNGLPAEKTNISGVCGEWGIKQIVAHLAGWYREAFKRFEAFAEGDTTDKRYDIDKFNDDSVAALRLLNWRETLDTFQTTYDDLTQAAQALPPDVNRLDDHLWWLRELARDVGDHRVEIETWLAEEAQ